MQYRSFFILNRYDILHTLRLHALQNDKKNVLSVSRIWRNHRSSLTAAPSRWSRRTLIYLVPPSSSASSFPPSLRAVDHPLWRCIRMPRVKLHSVSCITGIPLVRRFRFYFIFYFAHRGSRTSLCSAVIVSESFCHFVNRDINRNRRSVIVRDLESRRSEFVFRTLGVFTVMSIYMSGRCGINLTGPDQLCKPFRRRPLER